jgi:hypothetical protein
MPNNGYKFSDESRAKMRAAWKRKKARGYKHFRVLGGEEQEIRDEARQRGDKYYFFQRPCKFGHKAKRFVKSTACAKCSYDQRYRRRKIRLKKEPELMLYYSAKRRAQELGVPFSLTLDIIRSVWPNDGRCPVLGLALERHGEARNNSASLDRIDPRCGYVPGNVSIISHLANRIKYTVTDPEFFERLAGWMAFPRAGFGDPQHACVRPRSRRSCYRMWDTARRYALKNNVSFNLSPEDILPVWPRGNRCPILLVPFERNTTRGPCPTSPTLDRIIPKLGYTKGNVAVISYTANRAKSDEIDPETFRKIAAWLRRLGGENG